MYASAQAFCHADAAELSDTIAGRIDKVQFQLMYLGLIALSILIYYGIIRYYSKDIRQGLISVNVSR